MIIGGAIGWMVGIPLLGSPGDLLNGDAMDAAWTLWSTKIRYLGVGAMVIAGIQSIFLVRRGIKDGVGSMLSEYKNPTSKTDKDRNISLMSMGILFSICLAIIFGLYQYLLNNWGLSFLTTIIMVIMSFFLVAVASYIVGLVGSSNSPVSGMTISALLVTGALLLVFGYQGESAILATLGVAAVVCCATCTSGDVCQDLKTGSLVGASPRAQQIAEVIGVVIPAFVIAPVLTLLHKAYVIGEGLKAPQAVLFANLTQGIFGHGDVPKDLITYGVILGLIVIAIDELILRPRKSSFRLHLMAMAVGIYLPLSLTFPIFLGGIIRHMIERKQKKHKTPENEGGVLLASGLIAGESIMGVLIAILIVTNIDLKLSFLSNTVVELASLVGLLGFLFYFKKHAAK
ncbi:MAG: oligopeptide transporter, OPT family [Bdellovibrionota bacterium]